MEITQAKQFDNQKDAKTGQSQEMKTDNVFYDKYANMSDKEIAKIRAQRQKRQSFSGRMLNTHVPDEFKKQNLHYEWFVYDPIVVDEKIKNGWVIVSDEKLAALKGCSTTSEVRIPSGSSNKHGEPEQLILMAIHKAIYDDEVAAAKKRILDFDADIESGRTVIDEKGRQVQEGIEYKEVEI